MKFGYLKIEVGNLKFLKKKLNRLRVSLSTQQLRETR